MECNEILDKYDFYNRTVFDVPANKVLNGTRKMHHLEMVDLGETRASIFKGSAKLQNHKFQ